MGFSAIVYREPPTWPLRGVGQVEAPDAGLHWKDTSNLRHIVRVNHLPVFARRTTDPMRPFLLLDPGQHVVRITGMRPMSRAAAHDALQE